MQIDPSVMGSELVSTVTASAMAVSVIQWLKNSKWIPFMNAHTAGINRFAGWVAAFLSATGLHYTFDHQTGTLTLTGLTVAALTHTVWDTTKSYAFQALTYRGIFKQPAASATAIAEGMPVTSVASPGVVAAGVEQAKKG